MSKKKQTKKPKSKTSSIKQRNRLRNKGKIKTKKHVPKISFPSQRTPTSTEPEEDITDDMVEMVEKDDMEYLMTSISQQKYNLFKQIKIKNSSQKITKNDESEFSALEDKYVGSHSVSKEEYNVKMLLPVKTKDGVERRFMNITNEPAPEKNLEVKSQNINSNEEEEVLWLNKPTDSIDITLNEPISMAKIYAKRDEIIQMYKFRIGLLSSSLLENPELKIGNLSLLLEIMNKQDPELQITIKKLVTLSLLEIFKDLIPAYQIKHQDIPFNKLKKVTRQLMGYEGQLLKNYKMYLVKLEQMASCLRKKKGDTRIFSEQQKGLGVIAVKCLCELLMAHPYFNYADNIIHLLTLYLDSSNESVRKVVENCYKDIFHDDKRGLISLIAIRRINHLVKTRAHSVHCEALAVLLSLRIKNVNLDQEKEDEIKNKKFKTRRQKLLTMSKKERKRKKELEKLEKEMLEVKAEENKKSKEQYMTEIMKMVFLIYFRILKRAPRSNLLSITLEGLAKFTHCINLEYYQDIVNVLDHLLENEPLNIREQLYCIKTVFIILTGQGDALNVDPLFFYTHLYRVMLQIDAGKTYESCDTLLSTLEAILIHKNKKITTQRMLSFTKRIATLALQLLHNGSLGALCIIKSSVQLNKTADLLLDVDSNYGEGIYNAELNEPEYCNAGNTALWELCALRRHYHPVVQKMSVHISNGAPNLGEGSLPANLAKMTSIDFYKEYDPSSLAFKPSIPKPSDNIKKKKFKLTYSSSKFLDYCNDIVDNINTEINFSRLLLN
ncbi:hypothetical protein PGB90_007211 [Kerria lacca]